uniref:Uncharacterized protein n=1 Tax=Triticum urartu TaxID=4572 RepID=A0A8R7UXV0_TRIUA
MHCLKGCTKKLKHILQFCLVLEELQNRSHKIKMHCLKGCNALRTNVDVIFLSGYNFTTRFSCTLAILLYLKS